MHKWEQDSLNVHWLTNLNGSITQKVMKQEGTVNVNVNYNNITLFCHYWVILQHDISQLHLLLQ